MQCFQRYDVYNTRHHAAPSFFGVMSGNIYIFNINYVCKPHLPPLPSKIICWAFEHKTWSLQSPWWNDLHTSSLHSIEAYAGRIFVFQYHVLLKNDGISLKWTHHYYPTEIPWFCPPIAPLQGSWTPLISPNTLIWTSNMSPKHF